MAQNGATPISKWRRSTSKMAREFDSCLTEKLLARIHAMKDGGMHPRSPEFSREFDPEKNRPVRNCLFPSGSGIVAQRPILNFTPRGEL
jgi:hypothetical protein